MLLDQTGDVGASCWAPAMAVCPDRSTPDPRQHPPQVLEQADRTFIDLVRWSSREDTVADAEAFPQIAPAQAWLSTIAEVTDMSQATLVDARWPGRARATDCSSESCSHSATRI
jgi:hypothetical protein